MSAPINPKREDESGLQPVIAVGASVRLSPWYDLGNPVYKIFEKVAELKVYYDAGGQQEVRSVHLEGARLD